MNIIYFLSFLIIPYFFSTSLICMETNQKLVELAHSNQWTRFNITLEESPPGFMGDMAPYLVHLAVQAQQKKALSLLFEKGANQTIHSCYIEKGQIIPIPNPFHCAMMHKNFTIARRLLSQYPAIINSTDYHSKKTALHSAVFFGNTDGVYFLLQHKASITLQDIEGNTPFHLAAGANKKNIFKKLLSNMNEITENQKNPELLTAITAENNAGCSVLCLAQWNNNQGILLPLLNFLRSQLSSDEFNKHNDRSRERIKQQMHPAHPLISQAITSPSIKEIS